MEDYIKAHKYSINHRKQLLADEKCGCFYCLTIFNPKEITDWVEDISYPLFPLKVDRGFYTL